MNPMSRRVFVAALPLMAIGLASAARAQGNPPATTSATLFQNVRIFDGKGASLSAPSNVLIKGNIIERNLDGAYRCRARRHHNRRERPNPDAWPHRRSLARDADLSGSPLCCANWPSRPFHCSHFPALIGVQFIMMQRLGESNEATRVHIASRRSSRVAVRGARAAAISDATDQHPDGGL